MTLKFQNFARLAGIALAGFALLAASPESDAIRPATTAEFTDAVPLVADTETLAQSDEATAPQIAIAPPASLAHLVAQLAALPVAASDAAATCLATAVYFEARGEPLAGQLAVAQVILNRVASGRYPADVCGVVYQPRQFSFARRSPNTGSADWRTARAIATIAQAQSWLQVAPRALAFHAAFVTPGWNRPRVGQIGNHVFYR